MFDPTNVAVELPELALLGIDPIADGLTLTQLRQLVRSRNRGLKQLLLDQHHDRRHRQHLRRRDPARGTPAARTVVELAGAAVGGDAARGDPRRARPRAIVSGGSTLRDNQYVDLFGDGGSYQDDHRVYGRAGERCLTCGRGWVRRIVVGQRSTHFCPICQHWRSGRSCA